ncbi:hypothetical protein Pla110_01970 [Polystyrenella longa]|uniref:Uncharacterized protein n=1 Tax=Polystyrenella longa TaxID=2528007 RepID=A0A518CGZ1_9PLAN|nr:Trm112 family protein [Polystyrenella longa]QDU78493.1 hypothetical protein Pla110_01970 [Polystyrenella longa]
MAFQFESLKDIIACPKCHSKLIHDDSRLVCRNESCRLAFEILEDIPVMLVDEARELETEEWQTVMAKLDQK